MAELRELYTAVLHGDAKSAVAVTQQALAENEAPLDLIQGQMVPAMDEAGRLFEAGEYFIPELLLASRAMKSALALLRPLLVATGAQPAGRVVIATVQGDVHDIGKNLVASLLEGGGFEVHDLGADVAAERFVEAAQNHKADIVAMSTLLTVTMPAMKTTIETLHAAGIRDQVKVIIGGAPVTQQFADAIGADGYSDSAAGAVALARSLVAAKQG